MGCVQCIAALLVLSGCDCICLDDVLGGGFEHWYVRVSVCVFGDGVVVGGVGVATVVAVGVSKCGVCMCCLGCCVVCVGVWVGAHVCAYVCCGLYVCTYVWWWCW